MGAQKITNVGFLSEFMRRHEKLRDRPFCWVLGSGASFQSGIPTGATLAHQWLKELHEMEDVSGGPLEKWATAKNLGIEGFDFAKAASFYPFIYQRRFRDYKDVGYAELEKLMDRAEPSYGYSVLAQIMAGTEHKVAITTNFDNLISDALAIYTRALPLVCGHESLTGYIRAKLHRPLIAKIYRDLLFQPLNNEEEISKLADGWASTLTMVFQNYTPIIIGYGGNDGTLTRFLETLKPINGGTFWCYRTGTVPDERVEKIVARHHGRLVPILGFDELMLQLGVRLHLPSPLPELQITHDQRRTEFQRQFEELNKNLKEPPEHKATKRQLKSVQQAAEAAVERLTKEEGWWAWEFRAQATGDPTERAAVYREALKNLPESPELLGKFAAFLHYVQKNYVQAERLYRKALTLDSTPANTVTDFAMFQHTIRRDFNSAERLYRRALEIDPNNAVTNTNFANFLYTEKGNQVEAAKFYHKATQLAKFPAVASDTQDRFHSCFISFSHKDERFAQQLYAKLVGENINVWYAPKNIQSGRKIHEQIREGIKGTDKLLLVLSNNSLASPWVASELREAFRWEQIHGKRKLFPLRLMSFDTLRAWECFDAEHGKDLAIEVREFFIPDFSNWEDHNHFEPACARLLSDLKTNAPPNEPR